MVSDVSGPLNGIAYTPETRGQALDGIQTRKTEIQQIAGAARLSDNVVITDTAATLHALESAIAQVPEVDQKRVEALRDAIVNGSYRVDPERIADKLVQFESTLPSKSHTS